MSLLDDQIREANARRAEENKAAALEYMAEQAGVTPAVLAAKKFWDERKTLVENLRNKKF